MRKIRLIASDLDGTLLRNNKEISPNTREALKEAAQAGIQFVPATGRSLKSIPEEILQLPGTEYVLTSNGAAIYSRKEQKRIYERLVPEEAVEALLSIHTGKDTAIEVFVDGVPLLPENMWNIRSALEPPNLVLPTCRKPGGLWRISGHLFWSRKAVLTALILCAAARRPGRS